MNVADYFKALKGHDWYYEYSDDHRVWTRGRDNSRKLQAIAQEQPVLSRMYRDYADWIYMSPKERDCKIPPKLEDYEIT